MSTATILSPLVLLLETENGWSILTADDGSLTFQTAEGMTVTVSPLVRNDDQDHRSQAVSLMCDTGVAATALTLSALQDVLLFNFVLTNALGGALAIRPASRSLVLNMAVSAEPELDVEGLMSTMLAVTRVARQVHQTLHLGQPLCASLSLGSPGESRMDAAMLAQLSQV